MSDEAVSLRDINWRETFPFTHLFRAFRVAVHPSKLILALIALGCLWCGGLVLDAVWNHNHQVTPAESRMLNHREYRGSNALEQSSVIEQYLAQNALGVHSYGTVVDTDDSERYGIFRTFFAYEVDRANSVLMFRGGAYQSFESIWEFVVEGPLWLWKAHWFFALLYTAWFLLIWSVFGGAIARIAAVHVARDEKISVRSALTFSVSKVLSFIFAPVIPVLIVLGIGIVIAIAATILLHIPYVGPILAGLFFCFALLGGFVVTLVVLGTIGGFNLMYPTIGVEGSDSFDAISRSFSYVFARPWRMLWYTGVAIVYGAICYLFVRFFVWMVLAATWFFMSWLLGPHNHPHQPAVVWPSIWPPPMADPMDSLLYKPDFEHLKGTESAAAGLIVFWNYIVIGLIGAFAISFYFSANTIVYYLMRREVDATELDDVYVEETEDALDEPVAPASDTASTSPAMVIKEASTVRVYETEEGAPAPTEAPPPATGPSPESIIPPGDTPPGSPGV
jgi:hypothetical protein